MDVNILAGLHSPMSAERSVVCVSSLEETWFCLSFSIFLASRLASANLTAPEQFITSSASTQVATSSLFNCNAHCPGDAKTVRLSRGSS